MEPTIDTMSDDKGVSLVYLKWEIRKLSVIEWKVKQQKNRRPPKKNVALAPTQNHFFTHCKNVWQSERRYNESWLLFLLIIR